MPRFQVFIASLTIAGIALLGTLSGCGGKKEETPSKPSGGGGKSTETPKTETPKSGGKLTAIAAGDGVIKGKIVFAGDPAEPKKIPNLDEEKYKSCCLSEKSQENVDQKWLIGKDKGVANVVIFLKAPANSFFEPSDADKKRTDEVLIDQPHCAFIPHVVALYPSYTDADGKSHPSGQVFKAKNSANCLHNTKLAGSPLKKNVGNLTLKPSQVEKVALNPQEGPVAISCDVHPWMSAKAWVFDHPYAAVTGEDGTFEIKGVPVDTKIMVVGWHEGAGFFHGGPGGTETTVKKGEPTVLNVPIK